MTTDDILMFGPQFAKDFVNNYLKEDIPQRLIRYRNGWNVDDYALPDPLLYLTYEPIALDHWPTVITVAISTKSVDRTRYVSGTNPRFGITYSMRTYVWAKTEGSEEVTIMRDRLATVIRSAFLDYPSMKSSSINQSIDAQIDIHTITEEFSDLTLVKGDRVLAGAYIGYDLVIYETVYRRPIGFVDNIELDPHNIAGE